MSVVTSIKASSRATDREFRLKRLAVQIATMLPEEPADALMVVKYTEALLMDFLAAHTPIKRD